MIDRFINCKYMVILIKATYLEYQKSKVAASKIVRQLEYFCWIWIWGGVEYVYKEISQNSDVEVLQKYNKGKIYTYRRGLYGYVIKQ